MNTAAVNDPSLVSRGAAHFGNQCIVVAIDAKRVGAENAPVTQVDARPAPTADPDLALGEDSGWEVYTHGGRTPTGLDAVKWAVRAVELGAGEILLTSMDADGQLDGYDLPLTRSISQATPVPSNRQRRRRKPGPSVPGL